MSTCTYVATINLSVLHNDVMSVCRVKVVRLARTVTLVAGDPRGNPVPLVMEDTLERK